MNAATSEPRNISPSPTPTTSGVERRAATIVSAWSACVKTSVNAPSNRRTTDSALDEITCRRPVGVRPGHQVNCHLGIRVALKLDACSLELRTQRGEILDDSVVNDSQLVRRITMRMRITVGRSPMRRPPGMTHTRRTDKVIRAVLAELRLEVGQLTGLTLDLDPTGSVENRDSRRVVPAILHSP